MRFTGAFALFRLANRNKTLILTYHRFSTEDSALKISARALSEQLEYLRSRYRIVSLSELVKHLTSDVRIPPAMVAITIDDGYSDAYEIAFPILRKYDLPATFFVVTAFVDGDSWIWTDKLRFITSRAKQNGIALSIDGQTSRMEMNGTLSRLRTADFLNSALKRMPEGERDETIAKIARACSVTLPDTPPPEFAPVSWNEVREMGSARIEIGSHTVTHPILTNSTREQLTHELRESRSRLEAELGKEVRAFCYPNGNWDKNVRDAVALAGYQCAVTTEAGLNDAQSDLLALKRIHTERDLAHFAQATCGVEKLKVWLGRALPQPAV